MHTQEETIARLEREVSEALTRRDVETLRQLFDEDFLGINPLGIEVTQTDLLAQIASSDYQPESVVNDVRRVRLFAGIAVVTAHGSAKGTYQGRNADMDFTYTRIWIQRPNGWRAIAAHASPRPHHA